MHDSLYNVMGVVDRSGDLVERYEYTPYGQRTVFSHGLHSMPDANGDGQVDGNDLLAVDENFGEVNQRLGDANGDGAVAGDDTTAVEEAFGAVQPSTGDDEQVMTARLTSGSLRSAKTGNYDAVTLNPFGHQGLMHDEVIGLVYNRRRMLQPRLGRFMQRDPLGYVDGMNGHKYVASRPTRWRDPSGMAKTEEPCVCGPNVDKQVFEAVLRIAVRMRHQVDDGDKGLVEGLRFMWLNGTNMDLVCANVSGCQLGHECENTVLLGSVGKLILLPIAGNVG